jgi:quercetin dioxygenase-like cupin family protein
MKLSLLNQSTLALLTAGSLAIAAGYATAGECPTGQMKPNVRVPVSHAAVGVTDTTLASIDLGSQPAKLKGFELRFRRLVIEPGGVVPWHSHDERPAIILVVEGEIEEYSNNCAVPIVHKPGDVAREVAGTSHWWKNRGDKRVVLHVGDVRRDPNDKHM